MYCFVLYGKENSVNNFTHFVLPKRFRVSLKINFLACIDIWVYFMSIAGVSLRFGYHNRCFIFLMDSGVPDFDFRGCFIGPGKSRI